MSLIRLFQVQPRVPLAIVLAAQHKLQPDVKQSVLNWARARERQDGKARDVVR